MNGPLIPATVIGSWSFPGWYEKFIGDVGCTRDGSARSIARRRSATRSRWPSTTRCGRGSIGSPTARCSGSISTWAFMSISADWNRSRRPGTGVARARPAEQVSLRGPVDCPRRPGNGRPNTNDSGSYAERPSKMPVPGPFTLAGCIDGGERLPRSQGRDRGLDPDRQRRAQGLVRPGSISSSLTSPASPAIPIEPDHFLDVVARTVQGVTHTSACTCASETTGPGRGLSVIPAALSPHWPGAVNQLALEFASRELAEVELLDRVPETMDVAVGLVDVKNTWIEPAESGRRADRTVLKYVPAERRLGHARLRLLANRPAHRGGQVKGAGGGGGIGEERDRRVSSCPRSHDS